jgi:hypothetical protein
MTELDTHSTTRQLSAEQQELLRKDLREIAWMYDDSDYAFGEWAEERRWAERRIHANITGTAGLTKVAT